MLQKTVLIISASFSESFGSELHAHAVENSARIGLRASARQLCGPKFSQNDTKFSQNGTKKMVLNFLSLKKWY